LSLRISTGQKITTEVDLTKIEVFGVCTSLLDVVHASP